MGGVWAWRVDHYDTTGAFLSPPSPKCHPNEDIQADALLIVEQIRDYKDARYALVFACKNLVIPIYLYSGTRLSAILDVVPDMDSKLNFPQVVGVPNLYRRWPLTAIQRPLSLELIKVNLHPPLVERVQAD